MAPLHVKYLDDISRNDELDANIDYRAHRYGLNKYLEIKWLIN